ncbi:MAG: hypothetical protein B0W54_08245 [Cellvibrio sp. 79]|nr:MAG: hypothetical protein B0W54_08245 [Cellvibrio sp. 79]
MNIFLWVLQVLLALHTIMGAVWKFSHTAEQAMPSLKLIPQGGWFALAGVELLCAICLLLPALYKPAGVYAPAGAVGIALIMLAFCIIELWSSSTNMSSIIYWLVVVAVCAFITYGRLVLRPLG